MSSDHGQEDSSWPAGNSGAYEEGQGKLGGDSSAELEQQNRVMLQRHQLQQGASANNHGGLSSLAYSGMMQQMDGYGGQGSAGPASSYAMNPSAMGQAYSMYDMGMPAAMGMAAGMPGGPSVGASLYGMEASSIENAMIQQQNYMLQQMLQQQQMMQGYGGQGLPYAASVGGGINPYYMEQANRQQPNVMPAPIDPMPNVEGDRKPPRAKKNKLKPKRPLSAYNIFFRDERAKLLAEADAQIKGGREDDEAVKKEAQDSEKSPKNEGEESEKKEGGESDKTDKEKSAMESEVKQAPEVEEKEEEGSSDKPEDNGDKKVSSRANSKKRKREAHGKVSFETMAKIVGKRWKEIDDERLANYKEKAAEDMVRYKKEMNEYLEKQRKGLQGGHGFPESLDNDET